MFGFEEKENCFSGALGPIGASTSEKRMLGEGWDRRETSKSTGFSLIAISCKEINS